MAIDTTKGLLNSTVSTLVTDVLFLGTTLDGRNNFELTLTEGISRALSNEEDITTHDLASGLQYTVSGTSATATDDLDTLDQGLTLVNGDIISISGVKRDGTAVAPSTGPQR